MFDPSVVVRIDLGLSDDALTALAAEPKEYVPASFALSYGTRQFGPWTVSLKLKGGIGSFRPIDGKAAFKLKFPAGARPDGLKKLTLNNMVQDASKVHEAVSYELFRAMDVCAPRTGYAVVTVNGAPYGLYANVETLDALGLARCYPATQHLYEGTYGFLTDPTNAFDEHYEVDEGDDDDRSDLVALLATAQDFSPGWYARMATIADLDQMTRMWATEAYVGHWDGYTGPLVNNYYLHADGDGRFTMLPWGTDETLHQRTSLFGETGVHPLFDGCLHDPICSGLYADALATVARVARGMRLGTRAGKIARGIRAAIAADPKLEHPPSDARHELSATVAFLRLRRSDLAAWLATLPRVPRSCTALGGAGTIALEWRPLRGRQRTPIDGCAVEYRAAGTPWTRVELPADATTATLSGLAPGTYEVRVRRRAGTAASLGLATLSVVVVP